MGRYFGREPRYSREEIELQAQQAIEARVNMGRPPEGDWAPIEARLAAMDRELAARVPAEPLPEPPARRPTATPARPRPRASAESHAALSVTEVRLPAAAKTGRPARAAGASAAAGGKVAPKAAANAAPKARAPRRRVAATEG